MGGIRFAIIASLLALSTAVAAPLPLAWVNGDFERGDALWSAASGSSFADADGDGDMELALLGCGDGTRLFSREISFGTVQANTPLAFDIEEGQLDWHSFRMIISRIRDPMPLANNLFWMDPTGTLEPNWFDDHVLIWESTDDLTGAVTLDPARAFAVNFPAWNAWSEQERSERLGDYVHVALVAYGCTSGFNGGATVDDFQWLVQPVV